MPGARNSAAHRRADRQHERVDARPRAEVEGDLAARAHDPQRLGDERQGVVALAVLQRDVAEGDVGRVVGRCRSVRPSATSIVRSRSTLPKRATASRQRSRNPASRSQAMTVPKRRVKAHVMRPIPQPISTQRALVVVAVSELEALEVDGHLVVAGGDELGERQRVAGLVVEDPAGGLDDLVGARPAPR